MKVGPNVKVGAAFKKELHRIIFLRIFTKIKSRL